MPAIRLRSIGATIVAAALLACGGGGGVGGVTNPPPPGGGTPTPANTVIMGGSSFNPSTLTIQSGGTVTWNNTSGILHNVTFTTSGSPSNISDHTSGATSRTFGSTGTFNYNCTNHGGMNGSITVQ